MPPREAKGRYLTREYMADIDFRRNHDAPTRELYLMLSLFADDAGWLEWDPEYLMFACYRSEPDRDDLWEMGLASLVRSGRLRILKCGHAEMPKVAKSPRAGGQERKVEESHRSRCKSTRVDRSQPKSTQGDSLPDPTLPNRSRPNQSTSYSQHPAPARARGAAVAPLKDLIGELAPGILKDRHDA